MNMSTKRRKITVLTVIAVALAGVAFVWGASADDKKGGSSAATSDFGPQKQPNECVDKYNIVLDKNKGNRVLSNGLPKGTAEQKRDYVVTKAQHDPRVLQLVWNATPQGEKHPVTVRELVDHGCYSEKGRDIYQQTKGVYEAAAVQLEAAPADGVNTGVAHGAPFQEAGHISGNRSGISVTFHGTKKKIWIMDRCSNIVTKTPIPKVPTKPKPKCVPPSNLPSYMGFDTKTCQPFKKPQSKYCMLNGGVDPNTGEACPPNQAVQPVQNNPCCYTGPTVNGSQEPSPLPVGPTPKPSTSAPPPNDGGYDSGSGDGSGTPEGSTCDSSGCTGGGPSNPSPGPTDGTNSGDNNSGGPSNPPPPG